MPGQEFIDSPPGMKLRLHASRRSNRKRSGCKLPASTLIANCVRHPRDRPDKSRADPVFNPRIDGSNKFRHRRHFLRSQRDSCSRRSGKFSPSNRKIFPAIWLESARPNSPTHSNQPLTGYSCESIQISTQFGCQCRASPNQIVPARPPSSAQTPYIQSRLCAPAVRLRIGIRRPSSLSLSVPSRTGVVAELEAYPKEIKTLEDHLRKRRLDLGLLQREVAVQIGATESTIYNWERQRNTPEIRFIAPIIEFLGYNPLPTPTTLSEQLIFHRTRRGLSQEKFARILGVDPTTLASWETGRRRPSRSHTKLLSRIGIA